MEIDFNQILKQMDGTDILDEKEKQPMLLKNICINALLIPLDPQERIGGPEKMKRYDLAQKIYNTKNKLSVDAERITLLKKLVGDLYPPMIVGQVYRMLEGEKEGSA